MVMIIAGGRAGRGGESTLGKVMGHKDAKIEMTTCGDKCTLWRAVNELGHTVTHAEWLGKYRGTSWWHR